MLIKLIYSILEKGRNYYPKVFLKECKDIIKNKKKTIRFIDEEIKIFSDEDICNNEFS